MDLPKQEAAPFTARRQGAQVGAKLLQLVYVHHCMEEKKKSQFSSPMLFALSWVFLQGDSCLEETGQRCRENVQLFSLILFLTLKNSIHSF